MAQSDYDYQTTAKGPALKISNDYDFARHVKNKIIKDKYSPDAMIMDLNRNGFINPKTGKEMYSNILRPPLQLLGTWYKRANKRHDKKVRAER